MADVPVRFAGLRGTLAAFAVDLFARRIGSLTDAPMCSGGYDRWGVYDGSAWRLGPASDYAGNANVLSLLVNGTSVIDSSRNVKGATLWSGDAIRIDGNGDGTFRNLASSALTTIRIPVSSSGTLVDSCFSEGAVMATCDKPLQIHGAVLPYKFDPAKSYGSNLFDPAEQIPANIIDNSYLSDTGVVTSATGIYISSRIPVTPGQQIASIIGGGDSLFIYGGYYNGSTWISPIVYSGQAGQYVVPANATHIRINVERAYAGTVCILLVPNQSDAKMADASSMSCIGDSIVLGYGTDADNIWWKLAGEKLGCTQFQNLGIGGSTVAYPGSVPMSRRLDAIQESDIILLSGGANDYYYNIPLGISSDSTDSTFYGALNVIAKYLRETFLRSRIVFVTTTHKKHVANTAGHLTEDYAQVMKIIGNENGFTVIDMYSLVPNLTIPYWGKRYTTDGLHPGIALSRIMSEYAYKALS